MSPEPVVSVATGLVRPRWRGRIHAWAFWLALPAVGLLVWGTESSSATVGAAIYGVSLLAVFGASAAYHCLARTERAQRIMRRVDHSMIFVLIAGTYTPVCLLALPRSWWMPLLGLVWTVAGVGVAVKLWAPLRVLRASNGLYIILGWLSLVALPQFLGSVPTPALVLMFVGGALYTAGACLFMVRKPDFNPRVFGYHEVWHGFTVAAGASHFAMVAMVVLPPAV